MQRQYLAAILIGSGIIAAGCARQEQRAAQDAPPPAETPAAQQPPAAQLQPAQPEGGRTSAPGTRVVNPTGVDPRPVPTPQRRRETAAKPSPATRDLERTADAPKPARQGGTVAAGTTIEVRTTTALSTKTAKAGDAFSATLSEPLRDGDRVVAPKGATVEGRVVEADAGGRVRGTASLALELTRLELAGGRTVNISTNTVARQAESSKKKDALKVGIGSGIGAAIGAIAGGGKGAAIGAAAGAGAGTGAVLATRGDAAVLPSESVLTFALKSPVSY